MASAREQVEVLLAHADDRDRNVRNRVARELGRLMDPEAREAISEATRSSVRLRRFAAARAMRWWPADQLLPASELLHLLTDPDASMRWATVRIVATRDRLEFVGPLVASDPAPTVRQMALLSVGKIAEAGSIVVAGMKDHDYRVRAAAVVLLRMHGIVEAPQALTLALRDQFMWIRVNAVWAIAELGGPEAAPAIVPLLHDRKPLVRGVAARGLGKTGDAHAVEPLLDLLQRVTSPLMKSAAIIGLGHLADQRAVTPIIQVLRTTWDDDPRKPNPRSREGIGRLNLRRDATKALLRLGGNDADREIQRLPEDWVAWVATLPWPLDPPRQTTG